ncbi:hypothetical protein ACFTQL_27675 [Peribacillus butanolivorans]|uniref:hypothetical protein n=1 Tax=Peribacillus butanolivorans TaxID=421767 RepID=UPI00363DE07D
MKRQLQKAAEKGELVELYTDTEDVDKFAIAKVLKVSDDYVILANVSPIGMYDGFHLLNTDDVYQINVETRYIRNIEKLYLAKKQNHIEFNVDNENLMLSMLEFAEKNNFVILVELFEGGTVQGFIKKIEDIILVVSILTDFGEPDGESYMKLEDISSISSDNEEGICLKILYSDVSE